MISLIRFFEKEEYLNDFLNGHLYMNSIGHFWTLGQPNPQDDLLEGVIETMNAGDFDSQYGMGVSDFFGSHLLLPIMNRLEGYQFVHLLCFYMHEYDPELQVAVSIPASARGLGKYAVRIKNVQSFVDILFEKIKNENRYGLMGPIQYRQLTEQIEYMDCFDKSITHRDEHEWRFALIPDFEKAKEEAAKLERANADRREGQGMPIRYDRHFYFDVGNLRSIAEVVDAEKLITDPGKTYGNEYRTVDHLPYDSEIRKKCLEKYSSMGLPVPYQAYPDQYVGWSPRKAFRDKVAEIDRGIKPCLIIG